MNEFNTGVDYETMPSTDLINKIKKLSGSEILNKDHVLVFQTFTKRMNSFNGEDQTQAELLKNAANVWQTEIREAYEPGKPLDPNEPKTLGEFMSRLSS